MLIFIIFKGKRFKGKYEKNDGNRFLSSNTITDTVFKTNNTCIVMLNFQFRIGKKTSLKYFDENLNSKETKPKFYFYFRLQKEKRVVLPN